MTGLPRGAPRFSIVVPLYDCRDAGEGALASALGQAYPRERYEVIAVVDARARSRPAALPMCDDVLAVDADFAGVACEIELFDAGARAARGDWLYFIEGHTVLAEDALAMIDAHLELHGESAIVCGRRRNHARTALGRLVGMNNDAHESRARQTGDFTLGANCVVRRSVFERLGGLERRYARFAETVLYDRALATGERVDVIEAVLCTHHNDLGVRWLLQLLLATGRAKARYYATLAPDSSRVRIRHRIYGWLRPALGARLALAPLIVTGLVSILAAIALQPVTQRLAGNLYRVGIGCVDVAGFCIQRGFGVVTATEASTCEGLRNA